MIPVFIKHFVIPSIILPNIFLKQKEWIYHIDQNNIMGMMLKIVMEMILYSRINDKSYCNNKMRRKGGAIFIVNIKHSFCGITCLYTKYSKEENDNNDKMTFEPVIMFITITMQGKYNQRL